MFVSLIDWNLELGILLEIYMEFQVFSTFLFFCDAIVVVFQLKMV